jgi:DNA-binding response OmpR family regulator
MDNLNILIVEDESLLALELKYTIISLGYGVVGFATNNQTARELMQKSDINLILMDINLNDTLNGIELYQEFDTEIPVIYLTAYKDEDTISSAIETEPLGYLVKPYNEAELKALLQLSYFKTQKKQDTQISDKHMINFGNGYSFDTKEDKLFFNHIFIKLSNNELKLLKLLIQANGNPVSYYTIEHEIWSDRVPHTTSVKSLIYRLRGKLKYELIKNEFDYGVKLEFTISVT